MPAKANGMDERLTDLLLHTDLEVVDIAKAMKYERHALQTRAWRLYQRLGVKGRIGLMHREIMRLEDLLDAPAPHTKAAQVGQSKIKTKGITGNAT